MHYEPHIAHKQPFHFQCVMNVLNDLLLNTIVYHTNNERKSCTDMRIYTQIHGIKVTDIYGSKDQMKC